MGLIANMMRRMGYQKAINVAELQQLVSSVYSSSTMGIAQEKPYSALVDSYRSWVYTSVDKISKTVAMLPVELYIYRSRRTGQKVILSGTKLHEFKMLESPGDRVTAEKEIGLEREPVLSHPFLDLIHRPNGTMTRMMLWYETMIRMELAGMCCWYMPKGKLGIPGEIWPLPLTKTAKIQAKVSTRAELEYWHYQDGQVNQKFDPKEILFFHYPNPGNPWMGFSPLMAQTYPYDIDLFMMQQQRALYERGATPGIHLHTDQNLGPDQVKDIKEYLDSNYAGATKAGFPIITHSGLKLERAGFTPKEALLKDVAEWAREKLVTSYDLSDGKLGLVKDANRANMEALDVSFVRECMKPKTMLMEEAIETFLLPVYDQGLTLDFQLPDVANREMNVKERESNLTHFITVVNEEREKMGKPPVPWGDKPWVPMTMVQEGGQLPSEPVKIQEPEEEALVPLDFKEDLEEEGEDQEELRWKLMAELLRRSVSDKIDRQTEEIRSIGASISAIRKAVPKEVAVSPVPVQVSLRAAPQARRIIMNRDERGILLGADVEEKTKTTHRVVIKRDERGLLLGAESEEVKDG